MSATTAAPASGASSGRRFKRPDDKAMKKQVEELKNEIKKLDVTNEELYQKISKTVTDPEVVQQRKLLQAELKELKQQQGSIKQERQAIQDQIKTVDNGLKKKITEIQQLTSKNNFKSVAEIDSRINYLDSLVDQGDLKLADERRYIKEMSQLRKLKKDFSVIEKQQESIDKDKARIAELKKSLSAIKNHEVQQKFEKITKELNELDVSNKSVTDKRDELFKKKNAIKKLKDEKYQQIKKLRSDFDAEFDSFKKKVEEENKKRDEEFKAQREKDAQEKKKRVAEQKLAEASVPAFTKEINQIHLLLSYFDPSYVKPQPKSALPTATNTNTAIRQVEAPQDVVIIKKEQQSYFEGSKSKKGKGKKSAGKSKNFTVDPDVIVSLTDLSIPLPTKSEDVPATVEVLKETLKALEDKQEEQTKTNIERAKAEIEKLQNEEPAEEADAEEADEA